MVAVELPSWLTRNEAGAYIVDADEAYPLVLNALDLPRDQYGLEAAYQCVKLKVQEVVAATEEDPRKSGKPLAILIESKKKDDWRLDQHPEGKGALIATKGGEAKQRYELIGGKF